MVSEPHLPTRLTELLDVDSTTESDDEQGEALRWQAVIADHSIQHLQGDLQEGKGVTRCPPRLALPATAQTASSEPQSKQVCSWEALLCPITVGHRDHLP